MCARNEPWSDRHYGALCVANDGFRRRSDEESIEASSAVHSYHHQVRTLLLNGPEKNAGDIPIQKSVVR